MPEVAKKPWYGRWWGRALILLATLILIVLTAAGFYVFSRVKEIGRGGSPLDTISQAGKFENTEGEGDRWLGAARPKLTIVEFADFACPYSLSSYPKIRELTSKYRDRVKYIFRDHAYLTEYSIDLALSARCAGEQGLYWPMHDKLFQNQGVSARADLLSLAARAGADMERFTACFDTKKYLPKIQEDLAAGEKFGITGTPTWFINGYKVEGDLPTSVWEEIVKQFK